MRIPFSQLRFSPDSRQTWGLQVWRYVDSLNEQNMWSFRPRDADSGPAFFGHLEGLVIPRQPRQLEVLPYAVGGSRLDGANKGDPYGPKREGRYGLGGDLKYLLTTNLTLDATVNPDFGQVEVDPSVLNLSAFETYYDEKRPFFVAGRSAFRFGGMRCMFCNNSSSLSAFYSRRIGRPPQLAGYAEDVSDRTDVPEDTSILAAAKITGRTSGGYTIGILDAVTGEETARYLPDDGGREASQIVEPLTNYFVGRVKKEFRDGATTVGGIVTSVSRRTVDPVVDARLHGHADGGGHRLEPHLAWTGVLLDGEHPLHQRGRVAGGPRADPAIQRPLLPAPGQGGGARRALRRGLRPQRHGSERLRPLHPGGEGQRRHPPVGAHGQHPEPRLRKQRFRLPGQGGLPLGEREHRRELHHAHEDRTGASSPPSAGRRNGTTTGTSPGLPLQAYYGMEFLNYWNLRTFWIHDEPALDDRLTRGGPVVKRTGYDFGHFQVSTDASGPGGLRRPDRGSRGIGADTRSFTFGPGVALKPASNIFVQLSPTFAYDESAAQYVTTVKDPTAMDFFGSRYVFGAIRTRTVSLSTRLNWTFTPNLTLQLFAQPFVASGDYSSFREFAAPRTLAKRIYGVDMGTIEHRQGDNSYLVDPDGRGPAEPFSFSDPDFTTGALRGTAVLRWEYRPGSTLFFVWTQHRSSYDPAGSFGYDRAQNAIFDQRPVNVFQVKLTYWIGR